MSWEKPPPAERTPALAVVPVRGLSRLTREAVSAALSLANEAVAVTICSQDAEDEEADAGFARSGKRGPGRAADHPAHHAPRARPADRRRPARPGTGGSRRVVVVIPEVQPEHWWRWSLHNQRGFVLNRAVVAGTDNVVVCGSGSG